MATDTKTDTKSAIQEAADTAKKIVEAQEQEQATWQWTRTQEQAIGVLRDMQTNLLRTFPLPSEMIETSYDFAAKALQMQKEFSLRWVDWLTPRVPETEEASFKRSRR